MSLLSWSWRQLSPPHPPPRQMPPPWPPSRPPAWTTSTASSKATRRACRARCIRTAKRAVVGDTPYERLGLRRMSKDELVELTRQGVLKTPKEQWNRSCRVLDVTAETAAVRLETPWFVDHFHMGRFDGRWVIVNALWHSKPR